MNFIKESRETGICGDYDIIVVGGGVAGVAAALAAKRNGTGKVLLIEKQAVFGGLATAGHVVYFDPLCDGMGHKIFSGIPEELFYASIKYGYNTMADEWRGGPLEAKAKQRYNTVFNGPAFVFALDELIVDAKIDILFDTVFCDVIMEGDKCAAVIVENKSGRQAYSCKAVVDASGDADVLFRAGAPCMEQGNHLTYWCYCQADNIGKYRGPVGPAPQKVKIMGLGDSKGTTHPKGAPKYKGTDVHHITDFLLKSRKWALEQMKADPSLIYTSFPSQPDYRTTRRLVGEYTLLTSDVGKHFPDSIGCASIHNIAKPVFELPFGTLFTRSIKNIFAAGRIVSSSNGHAWEITRTIPCCAQTGQAAGSAASILVSTGKAVEIGDLQSVLKKDGVVFSMSDEVAKQAEEWGAKDWIKLKEDLPFYRDRSGEDELYLEF